MKYINPLSFAVYHSLGRCPVQELGTDTNLDPGKKALYCIHEIKSLLCHYCKDVGGLNRY